MCCRRRGGGGSPAGAAPVRNNAGRRAGGRAAHHADVPHFSRAVPALNVTQRANGGGLEGSRQPWQPTPARPRHSGAWAARPHWRCNGHLPTHLVNSTFADLMSTAAQQAGGGRGWEARLQQAHSPPAAAHTGEAPPRPVQPARRPAQHPPAAATHGALCGECAGTPAHGPRPGQSAQGSTGVRRPAHNRRLSTAVTRPAACGRRGRALRPATTGWLAGTQGWCAHLLAAPVPRHALGPQVVRQVAALRPRRRGGGIGRERAGLRALPSEPCTAPGAAEEQDRAAAGPGCMAHPHPALIGQPGEPAEIDQPSQPARQPPRPHLQNRQPSRPKSTNPQPGPPGRQTSHPGAAAPPCTR